MKQTLRQTDKEIQSFNMPWEEEYGYAQAVISGLALPGQLIEIKIVASS
ncbi:hypothetical protein [Flavitalea sp.]|nr:hypothetical protein [Flavitalea sp.]